MTKGLQPGASSQPAGPTLRSFQLKAVALLDRALKDAAPSCRWCGIALVVEDDHGNSIQQGEDGECDECHWWKMRKELPEFPAYIGWDGREHAEY